MSSKEPTEQELKQLKDAAYKAKNEAEQLMHKYACALPVGDDRIAAFETYNDIRLAGFAR